MAAPAVRMSDFAGPELPTTTNRRPEKIRIPKNMAYLYRDEMESMKA